MKHTEDTRKEARDLYIKGKMRDLSALEKATGVTRTTLRDWRDKEKWDEISATVDVDPQTILQMYLRLELKLLQAIEATEMSGQIPADTTIKRQIFYRKMAHSIDAQFDVGGAILRFAEQQIDFYSAMPDFEGKKEFIKVLSEKLPEFIEFVIHSK